MTTDVLLYLAFTEPKTQNVLCIVQEPSDVLPQADLRDRRRHRLADDRVPPTLPNLLSCRTSPAYFTCSLDNSRVNSFDLVLSSVTAYTLQDDARDTGELDYINGGNDDIDLAPCMYTPSCLSVRPPD